jgi:hypothetical protein
MAKVGGLSLCDDIGESFPATGQTGALMGRTPATGKASQMPGKAAPRLTLA